MSRRAQQKQHTRWDLIVASGVIVVMVAQPHWNDFKQSRLYRDWNNLTPFEDVNVTSQDLIGQTLLLSGDLHKVQCVWQSLSALVELETGVVLWRPVDTSLELSKSGVEGNRPPDPRSQLWGPWTITYDGELGTATDWSIHASHIQCPTEPYEQFNEFANGDWSTVLP
jgi:hypothetical protein